MGVLVYVGVALHVLVGLYVRVTVRVDENVGVAVYVHVGVNVGVLVRVYVDVKVAVMEKVEVMVGVIVGIAHPSNSQLAKDLLADRLPTIIRFELTFNCHWDAATSPKEKVSETVTNSLSPPVPVNPR